MTDPHASTPSTDAAAAVREILEEARRVVGTGPLFAARLHELGVGPEKGQYSESAISNWINGRTMPPADVLLAAATIAGISLDARLLGRSTTHTPKQRPGWQGAVGRLQTQLDALRSDLIELYGRLGYPMPHHELSSDTTDSRARSAAGGSPSA
jgi:transcriptional regulator with XRE-family HTH domain